MPTVFMSRAEAKAEGYTFCVECGKAVRSEGMGKDRRCVLCDTIRELRKGVDRLIESGDYRAIAQAAGWVEFAETDAKVYNSARASAYIDRAVSRASRIAEAEAAGRPFAEGYEDAAEELEAMEIFEAF